MTQIAHLEATSEGDGKKERKKKKGDWLPGSEQRCLLTRCAAAAGALPAAALGWLRPCLGFFSAAVPSGPSAVAVSRGSSWGGGAVRGGGGAAAPCASLRCPVRPSQHAQRHKQRHEARCSSARCQLLSQPSTHTRLPGGPRLRAPREWGSRTPDPQAAPLLHPATGCRCSPRAAEPKLAVSGVRG